MNLENLLNRFLKENGLYGNIVRQRKYCVSIGYAKTSYPLTQLAFYCETFRKKGIEYLFNLTFGNNSLFLGNHNSKKRKYFYKLNKKWKEFIHNKCRLQHNIEIGDEVECFGLLPRFVKIIGKENDYTFVVKDSRYADTYLLSIFSIKNIKSKKMVFNIYYKDENGINYGKVNGSYNDIQL